MVGIRLRFCSLLIGAAMILGACSDASGNGEQNTAGESFASAQAQPVAAAAPVTAAAPVAAASHQPIGSKESSLPVEPQATPAVGSPAPEQAPSPAALPSDNQATESKGAILSAAEQTPVQPRSDAAATPLIEPAAAQVNGSPAEPASEVTRTLTQPSPPSLEPKSEASGNELHWNEFFDDDKQSTPSDKFWELSGKTVTIKGYMGEVLSFEKHWFLIIPAPGAECPFDNGDETYWNKIMMAFTDKDTKLRYTSGALQITGRLDVGVKIDESGYKTMFRLYDAKVEKLKE